MRILIINKSDSTGGAAVVSRRLMEALRENGVDARMLVCEKLSDSPYVELAASQKTISRKFVLERLKILISDGFNLKKLFKIDTGAVGLQLWDNPLVKSADAVLINWVNQGMLSLKGIKRILKLGKPVICTMHDMWWMTGICHHSGKCQNYLNQCGDCPLLGWKSSPKDVSHKVWKRKNNIYSNVTFNSKLAFVAVSNWLKQKAAESSLLQSHNIYIIHNAFKIYNAGLRIREDNSKVRILFGAARLDDPIKGLVTLKKAAAIIATEYPDMSRNIEIVMFGAVKNPLSLDGFVLPLKQLGVLQGEEEIAKAYTDTDIVVSASSYETLPGTLVEAQAYGCIPVCFKRGGQPDIINQLSTGYMADYDDNLEIRAKNLTQGLIWAYSIVKDPEKLRSMVDRMKESVEKKFSYNEIASKYLSLIRKLKDE